MSVERVAFWREESPWPFVHAVVPLALYVSTRELTLSILLLYVWESAETIISLFSSFYAESKMDSLVGDPLIGASAILIFYAFDQILELRAPFLEAAGLARRIGAFAIIALLSTLAAVDRNAGQATPTRFALRYGVALFALLYAGIVLAFYGSLLSESAAVSHTVLIWLSMVFVHAIVATPVVPLRIQNWLSVWLRTFYTIILWSLVAVVTFVVHKK